MVSARARRPAARSTTMLPAARPAPVGRRRTRMPEPTPGVGERRGSTRHVGRRGRPLAHAISRTRGTIARRTKQRRGERPEMTKRLQRPGHLGPRPSVARRRYLPAGTEVISAHHEHHQEDARTVAGAAHRRARSRRGDGVRPAASLKLHVLATRAADLPRPEDGAPGGGPPLRPRAPDYVEALLAGVEGPVELLRRLARRDTGP